ncbi:MAG: D-alanyl-D-alanine carboxypeptidase/D-alanyl-D-alanine-endopeptidase [Terriglobia bacterium]
MTLLSRRLLASTFLLLAVSSLAPAAKIREVDAGPHALVRKIEAILRSSDARRGQWGIAVVQLSNNRVLYTREADRLFLPASNMKLFTTAAAVEELGPDFVFRTTVESSTPPDAEGRVADLILVGRGDPTLGNRVMPGEPTPPNQPPADAVFQKLADQVAARGVREVAGNLIADDSYFLYEPFSHGWEEEDLQWGYGAPVTALAVNDNALLLRARPASSAGASAQVTLEPFADLYQLNNRLLTAVAGRRKQIYIERAPGSNRLDVWGEIPLGADEEQTAISIANPPLLAGELLRRALEARGIRVRGRVEVYHLSRIEAATADSPPAPSPARITLAENISSPLREELKLINKFSQNLHVEMLLRTLGQEVKHYGSLTVGLEVLNEFAARVGIEPGEVNFADGSGLSRHDLVTPRAVVKLLKFMSASSRSSAFLDSLPVAGVDGTLDERFNGTPLKGRVRAKTGTMEHTNALSGYMDLPTGERLAFSIIGNGHLLSSFDGAAVIDEITLAIYRHFARRGKMR